MKPQLPPDLCHLELETILRFGALINSSLHIEDVIDTAMKWSEEFMNAAASTVYELDQEKGEIFVRLARGEKSGSVRNIRLKIGEGIAGMVVETGRPVIVQDVHQESRFSGKFDRVTGFKTKSMICVPLILRDKPVGALQVLNKKDDRPFSASDQELLTAMAHQIAVALENAKLYRRLEEKFELTASELKKTQEKLIRTERLTAMGHLVQGVAHEIRNPIMTIGGFAHRAKSSQADDKKRQRYLDIILEETARLENLVQEVHEFAEIQTVRLSPGRLEDVVREVLGGMETEAEEREVTLKAVTEDALPPIDMDFSQLKRALRNVLVNALESMDDGGVIDLRVGREDDHVAITVCDTGCGIPEKDLDAVYDPFVTSKTRGAGLGLTMVHQIVMNHRGEIGIQSKEGEGTTVTIRLPFSPRHDWKEQA